jgi:hypothetical protein
MRLSLLYLTSAALILGSVACAPPPEKGVVISTMYNRAHYDVYMYCGMYTTTRSNGVSYTNCTLWLTGHDWVPDEWSLKLKDGKHKGWRQVPQSVYNGPCGQLDAIYPGCMS